MSPARSRAIVSCAIASCTGFLSGRWHESYRLASTPRAHTPRAWRAPASSRLQHRASFVVGVITRPVILHTPVLMDLIACIGRVRFGFGPVSTGDFDRTRLDVHGNIGLIVRNVACVFTSRGTAQVYTKECESLFKSYCVDFKWTFRNPRMMLEVSLIIIIINNRLRRTLPLNNYWIMHTDSIKLTGFGLCTHIRCTRPWNLWTPTIYSMPMPSKMLITTVRIFPPHRRPAQTSDHGSPHPHSRCVRERRAFNVHGGKQQQLAHDLHVEERPGAAASRPRGELCPLHLQRRSRNHGVHNRPPSARRQVRGRGPLPVRHLQSLRLHLLQQGAPQHQR